MAANKSFSLHWLSYKGFTVLVYNIFYVINVIIYVFIQTPATKVTLNGHRADDSFSDPFKSQDPFKNSKFLY
jgi:hypothetical protein